MAVKIIDYIPNKGTIGASRTTPIFFRIQDTGLIYVATLNVQLNGLNAILAGQFQLGYHGTITNENALPTIVSVNIIQEVEFDYNEEVTVDTNYQDSLATVTDSFSFICQNDPDNEPLIVSADVRGGYYSLPQTVSLTTEFFTSDRQIPLTTTIYYTTDTTDPTLFSNQYTTPLDISVEGQTQLKFVALDADLQFSKIETETYNLDYTAPTTIATPTGGDYFSTQNVVLSSDEPSTIFFTTNATIPTSSSQTYTTPIIIPENKRTVLKFFAIDTAGNVEAVEEEVYNIYRARNNIKVQNVFISYPYVENALDIRWDDMYPIYTNIIGYNVYRADDPKGNYEKVNDRLITTNQYRDSTLDLSVINENVSEQFRRTVNISREVNDNFSEPDYDKMKWIESDPAQLMFQNFGVIFTDKVGLIQGSKLVSKFKLKNDFDIQIDFNLTIWNAQTKNYQACGFGVKTDDDNAIWMSRERSTGANIYHSNRIYNGNIDIGSRVSSNDLQGSFRITRSGTTITTFYLSNGSFVNLGTYTNYNQDMYVEILGKSANVPIEMNWQNFVMNSGIPIIIEPRNQLLEYFIQTANTPIVDNSGTGKPTDDITQITVTIDAQKAVIKKLYGLEGQIELDCSRNYDEVRNIWIQNPKPTEFSTVLVTYRTTKRKTNLGLRKKYFYKVTAVTDNDETDLDVLHQVQLEGDRLSWIFEEAIRRNSWILDNAGERVLLFLKKRAGKICKCVKRDVKERTHKQPDQDCDVCYGSGFVGGFDGPYPIRIATPMTEQKIAHTDRGLTLQYQTDTWTSPTPLLSIRDMIVRRNGDRCLVGPPTPVEGPGGYVVQQHFSIEVLDRTDIRYTFPIQPLQNQFSEMAIDKRGIYVPEVNAPKEREELITQKDTSNVKKGRTIMFDNINYGSQSSTEKIDKMP
jgi:hypothetical protein